MGPTLFKSFSLEDVYTLRKAIELKQVDTYWELGILHVARIKLLAAEFRYDALLQDISDYLTERCQDWIDYRGKGKKDFDARDLELIFKDQPFLTAGGIILYDVNNCKYKNRLIKKYPEIKDVIMDLVHA